MQNKDFGPHEVGVRYPLNMCMCLLTWILFKFQAIGIFMDVSSCRHTHILPLFPAPLFSLENEGGAKSFSAVNHGLAFLVISTIRNQCPMCEL